jgi:hypothetical protein
VYRAVSPVVGVITTEYRDGVWKVYSESGEVFCDGTYVVEDGRIWLTFATDLTPICPDAPGSAFIDAAWTLEGDQLRFSDINNGNAAAVAEWSLPYTRIDDSSAPGDEEETAGSGG